MHFRPLRNRVLIKRLDDAKFFILRDEDNHGVIDEAVISDHTA